MGIVVPLRRQLQASVDLLDLGEILEVSGSMMASAGRHVSLLNELPTDHMLREIDQAGRAMCGMVATLRLAAAVELPCDSEGDGQ